MESGHYKIKAGKAHDFNRGRCQKSEQAAQNARKQIARRGETAVYATVEEAEAWVEQQKAARTRR